MKTKPNIKETLLSIEVGSTITEITHYNSFLQMKSKMKRENLGEWIIKKRFDTGFDIYRKS